MPAIVSLVSRHRVDDEPACRVLLDDGTTQVLRETDASRMLNGEAALAAGPPKFDTHRTEPQTFEESPRVGSVIRVLIQGSWMSCIVKNVYPPAPPDDAVQFVVEYDDGLLVKDRLCVPWDYVLPPLPQSCGAGSSSDPLPSLGFDVIVEAAAQMQAEAVVDGVEPSNGEPDPGTPSPYSSHSGFSTATAFLGASSLASAQAQLDALQEAPEAGHDFEALDANLSRLMGFKQEVAYV